jgi:hypothetical protein
MEEVVGSNPDQVHLISQSFSSCRHCDFSSVTRAFLAYPDWPGSERGRDVHVQSGDGVTHDALSCFRAYLLLHDQHGCPRMPEGA